MQWTKYVGIPYRDKGRDAATGLDCWGLARHVYREEFSITLPDFSSDYESDDTKRIEELIAIHKEGWEQVEEPKPGHLVLFRVLGADMHVGIYLGKNKFLHSIENQYSAIERIDSLSWRNRVVGFFKYTEKSIGGALVAQIHPLRTENITVPVPEGTTVRAISEWVVKEYKIEESLIDHVAILINGRVISKEEYDTVKVRDGDMIQYRPVPGKSALRTILFIAVAIYAPQIAGYLAGAGASAATVAAYTVGVTLVGQLLVNAIFPIRPPDMQQPGDPGSAGRQLLMQGGSNTVNKYGAVPVVLGKVRMTAPVGAKNFVESADETSDLNMMLVWGFGPLAVSDLNIGATSIDQYENGAGRPVQYVHLNDTLENDPAADVSLFNSIYASDIEQNFVGIKLTSDGTLANSPWIESTLVEPDINRLGVTFAFPQGLRRLLVKGEGAGAVLPKECRIELQYRSLDEQGNPSTAWQDSSYISTSAKSFTIPSGYTYTSVYSGDSYTNTYNQYYRWTRIAIDQSGNWVTKTGGYCTSAYTEPTPPQEPNRYWNNTYDPNAGGSYVRLPQWSGDEIPVIDICMVGDTPTLFDTSIRRPDYVYSGLSNSVATNYEYTYDWETIVSKRVLLTGGYVSRNTNVISLGLDTYVKRKDPFTHTQRITVPTNPGGYQVRVRRLDNDENEPDDTNRYMHDVQLQTVTGYTNRSAIVDPPNCRITRTALRIRATDQLNGQIEGINAYVQTICPVWDSAGQIWRYGVTSNPAALFRYILQHPANAMRIKDSELATRIDLEALEDWHEYCDSHGLQFNMVVAQQRSLLEVLRDVAAAGRASPITLNGKWSVVIDRPRVDVTQHFTPHNSWGFESVKALPKRPDGLKITFPNELKGFQEEELIVYAVGKNESNSEIFEQISLPGITNAELVKIHARWHFAQATLRPEVYTLNADLEHIVSTRGDRVKVTHDVPMWGLGSGRIKGKLSNTVYELDEPVPMQGGQSYVIRIRTGTGESIVRPVVPAVVDGYYGTITLVDPIFEADKGIPGDLFMFGEVNLESNDLIILSIEPFGAGNAKITLTDYSPQIYDVNYRDTNFVIPEFESKITRLPELLQQSITVHPEIVSAVSDETVLEQISPGIFRYNLKVGYRHIGALPEKVSHVEVQIDYTDDNVDNWLSSGVIPINQQAATFTDVVVGDTYKIRVRYISDDGRTGPWSEPVTHTIVGNSLLPAVVSNFSLVTNNFETDVYGTWDANAEPDISGYEVRIFDIGWGENTNYVYKGQGTSFSAPTPSESTTYYIRAYDTYGKYSPASASASYTKVVPLPATLTASGKALAIQLDWVFGSNTSALNSTEIYFSSSNDRITATLLASVAFPTNTYTHTGIPIGTGYYYWIRVLHNNGSYSDWYPAPTTAGIYAEADQTESADIVIGYIANQITESELSTSLNTRIDLIDGPPSLVGSVDNRIEAAVTEAIAADLTPPPTATLSATAGINSVFVNVTDTSYTQGSGHRSTKLYGAQGLNPSFNEAVELESFSGSTTSYSTEPATTWFLWAKFETNDGVLSVEPSNRVEVTTSQDVGLLLDALAGEITTSELSTSLNTRIDLIDGPPSLVGSVDNRIEAAVTEAIAADLTPPPTATLSATAGINSVFVNVTGTTYTQGHGHRSTKLYGAQGLNPSFNEAVELESFSGSTTSYSTEPATTWFLWAKFETNDGVLSVEPSNRVEVTTSQDVGLLLDALAGEITTSELSTSLNTRIDLIDGDSTVPGSVNSRIETESLDLNEKLQIESHTRLISVQDAASAALEAAIAANQERTDRVTDVALARTELNENLNSGLSAEASQRTLLAAQLRGGYTGDTLNQVTSGLIYQERIARAEQDSALALQITLLSAGVGEQFDWKSIWYFDTGVEDWTGNGTPTTVEGFLRPANQASSSYVVSPAGLDVDTTKYSQVRLRIRKVGNPTFAGFIWWKAEGSTWEPANRLTLDEPAYDPNNIATLTLNVSWQAVPNIDQVRLDLSSAQTSTDYFEIDWFAIGRPSPAASTAQILEEQAARTAADAAETISRETLSTFLFGAPDPTGVTLGNISSGLINDEKTSRISADESLSLQITSLNSAVIGTPENNFEDGLEHAVVQNTSDILIVNQTLADLGGSSSTVTTELKSVSRKLDIDADTALRNLLAGEKNKTDAQNEVALAREELKTDIVTGLSAEASARLTLQAQVEDNEANLQNNYYTKSTVDSAIASASLTLDSKIDDNQAELENSYYTKSNVDSAIAGTKTTLRAYSDLGSKTFSQTTAPTFRGLDPETGSTVSLRTGDFWIDTDDGNRRYVWSGSSWTDASDAKIAAADARITTVETTKIGYCSIGGTASDQTSKADCEAAGGVWSVGLPLATAVKQVSVTDANGSSAKIEQAFTTQKTLNDNFKAQYGVKLDVNGYVSGYNLYNDITGSSEFIVSANRFAVTAPQTSIPLRANSTAYAVGAVARISGQDAFTLVCKTAGTTSTTAPTGLAVGAMRTDGTVVWQVASRVPFAVQAVPSTINGVTLPAGVYIDAAYILNATVQTAQVADSAITNSKISSLEVGKLTAGTLQTNSYIRSSNYVAGTTGFNIPATGTAEFSGVTVRGTVNATSGDIGGVLIDSDRIRSGGMTNFTTGSGFWFGSDGRVQIGNTTGSRLVFDGSSMDITLGSGGNAVALSGFVDGVKAQYSVKLDVNNNISGYGLYNQGTNSKFIVSADTFAVATPSSSLTLWASNTAYLAGRNIRVTSDNARMLVCKVAGTSGGTQPSLVGRTTGDKIIDGTVTWQIASRVPFAVTTSSTTVENTSFNPGVYIDGAFITNQTISPESIDTRNLTVKDANGNIIFGASNNLDISRVANKGAFATLDSITANNISTYIAAGAIGNAYIGNAIQSADFNGTVNSSGLITANGTIGWAIGKGSTGNAGKAVFNDVVVRGNVIATSGEFTGTVKAGTTLLGGSGSSYSAGSGLFAGLDSSVYKFRVGNPTGARIQWDGSNIAIYNSSNQITLSSGGVDWAYITGTGKPADNATKNTVTYAATSPSSPTNGDIWVDTSVTPNITKVYVSNAWQISANYTTNTTQLTDGANLGQTASWTSIANLPEQDNLLRLGKFSATTTGWTSPAVLATSVAFTGTQLNGASHIMSQTTRDNYEGITIPVVPGEVLWFSGFANSQYSNFAMNFGFRTSIDGISQNNWPTVLVRAALQSGWTYFRHSIIVPAGVNGIIPFCQLNGSSGFGTGYWSNLRISRQEPSATKNSVNYSSTEPTNPTNGDIWVDTSLSPNVSKVRVSGAWQVSSTVGATFNSGSAATITGNINSTNISTYIASAAITDAYIGNFIKSTNFNGTVGTDGAITNNGTTGWAIGKGGKAVFQDAVVRGEIEASSLKANTVMVNEANIGSLQITTAKIANNAVTSSITITGSASSGISGNINIPPSTTCVITVIGRAKGYYANGFSTIPTGTITTYVTIDGTTTSEVHDTTTSTVSGLYNKTWNTAVVLHTKTITNNTANIVSKNITMYSYASNLTGWGTSNISLGKLFVAFATFK